MNTTRRHIGGHMPGIFSACALFLLLAAALLGTNAARGAVLSTPLAESSSVDAPKSHAYAPDCDPDWTVVPSPNVSANYHVLNGVSGASANDMWAVGYYDSGSSAYQTLILHWDGSAWTITPSPNVGTSNNYLNSVAAVSANDVWAVGYYGEGVSSTQTLILHWDGNAWSAVPSPSVDASFNTIFGVDAVAASDVWAAGYYVQSGLGRTLILHWDGGAWTIIPSPSVGTFTSLLFGVSTVSANDVWAAGRYINGSNTYQTLILHWDGSAWTITASPNVGSGYNLLSGIAAVSANDVWAVGFYKVGGLDQTLILHWNGSAWLATPSPDPGINHNLKGVAAVSANDVWAVGTYDDNSSSNSTLILHWNGIGWSAASSSNVGSDTNSLNGVAAISANNVWAVGNYANEGEDQTLVERYVPCLTTPTLTPGTATPTRTATQIPATPTAVPTQCTPAWMITHSPSVGSSDNELRAVAAVSSSDVWAVGYYGDNQIGFQSLTEHWDGSTWTVVDSPNPSIYLNFLQGVTAISSNDVWAVGYYRDGDFAKTMTIHWDGNAWTVVLSPNPDEQNNRLLGVDAIASDDVWAVGFLQDFDGVDEIDHSITLHWDGSAWSVIASPNPSDFTYLYAVTAISSNDVWAVGLYHTSKDFALAMHWDGSVWDVDAVPEVGAADNHLYAVTGISSGDVWTVGMYVEYSGSNRLEHTLTEHWDGSAWSVVASPDVGNDANTLNAVAAISGNDVWAVGEYNDRFGDEQTLTEHWDGSVWSVVASPSSTGRNWLLGIAAIASNDVWAVGLQNDLYQTLAEHYSSPCVGIVTPTVAATGTATSLATGTVTSMPTVTPTATMTNTPITPAATGTGTATSTNSPVATATDTPSGTPSGNATSTPGAATATPTVCAISFEDVPPGSTFYPYVQCMACRGIINGYPCGGEGEPCDPDENPYFRPGDNVTRGQLSKIVSLSAGYSDPPSGQLFEDVSPGATFYTYIQQLASRGHMNGYPCGGVGEPCVEPDSRPYFRPSNNATRGQISKIVSNAAGFVDPPGTQIFEDVPPGSTFYDFVQRLAGRDIMGGYPCGGVGEPCVEPDSRPYFRPSNNATRGQSSKIVANTFFPECSP